MKMGTAAGPGMEPDHLAAGSDQPGQDFRVRVLATHGGVHMAGTVTVNGTDRDVTFTDLVVNGNDFGTPTWTFEAL